MKGDPQIFYVRTVIVKIKQHKNLIQYHIILQHIAQVACRSS